MQSARNYLNIDNPNIPVLCKAKTGLPFGQMIKYPIAEAGGSALSPVQIRDMYLSNFSIRSVSGKFEQDTMLANQRGEALEFMGTCLIMQGNIRSFFSGGSESVVSFDGSQNFKYDPLNDIQHLCAANDPFHFVHFSYSADYFNQFLPDNESWTHLLKEKVNRKETILGNRFTPITLAQERAWQNIINCPLDGKLGLLMIETSVVQIILLQLHSLFNSAESFSSALAKRDIEIVQGLKDHLTMNFLDDHSLTDLARHFGTNTNKLMTLFKKSFGKSIFEYISELRMDYASQMLREKDAMVIEVARTLGYKNANHFSTAFKKKYGVNPSQVR